MAQNSNSARVHPRNFYLEEDVIDILFPNTNNISGHNIYNRLMKVLVGKEKADQLRNSGSKE